MDDVKPVNTTEVLRSIRGIKGHILSHTSFSCSWALFNLNVKIVKTSKELHNDEDKIQFKGFGNNGLNMLP